MHRDAILAIMNAERGRLREELAISGLSLFGSVARGEEAEGSDVDVLVEFDRPVGLFHLIRAQQELERVLPRGLRPEVRGRVLAEAIRVG